MSQVPGRIQAMAMTAVFGQRFEIGEVREAEGPDFDWVLRRECGGTNGRHVFPCPYRWLHPLDSIR